MMKNNMDVYLNLIIIGIFFFLLVYTFGKELLPKFNKVKYAILFDDDKSFFVVEGNDDDLIAGFVDGSLITALLNHTNVITYNIRKIEKISDIRDYTFSKVPHKKVYEWAETRGYKVIEYNRKTRVKKLMKL